MSGWPLSRASRALCLMRALSWQLPQKHPNGLLPRRGCALRPAPVSRPGSQGRGVLPMRPVSTWGSLERGFQHSLSSQAAPEAGQRQKGEPRLPVLFGELGCAVSGGPKGRRAAGGIGACPLGAPRAAGWGRSEALQGHLALSSGPLLPARGIWDSVAKRCVSRCRGGSRPRVRTGFSRPWCPSGSTRRSCSRRGCPFRDWLWLP